MLTKYFIVLSATGTILAEIHPNELEFTKMLFSQIKEKPFDIIKMIEHPADPNYHKADMFLKNLNEFLEEKGYGN